MDQRDTIGVDTGGTFTDVVLLRPDGEVACAKAATTPHDFSVGVMDALEELARALGTTTAELLGATAVFKHGTTVATNALITRRGARVGLVTTRGFEDTHAIMRAIGRVDGLGPERVRHAAAVTKPAPLVPRVLVRGVRERIDYRGRVVVPLRTDDVDRALRELVEDEGCQAIAVSLLHAWANPDHERAVGERLRALYPGREVFLSLGSDLSQLAGEYARGNTAIANCFVGPTVERYLTSLDGKLRDAGLRGTFLVMQGNGGAASPGEAPALANLQSGPAAGLIAASHMSRLLGHDKVLTADMGGTSLDVGVVVDGAWEYAEEPIFERFRLQQPIAHVESIGAGGGTIARGDELVRRMLVGPDSAGADPGPACYGSGTEATVTDVDVVLGYIDPDNFLGGRRRLDRSRAERSVAERLAAPLGLDLLAAAAGAFEIVNNKMADLIRRRIAKSGHSPEEFRLYAYGGAGPVHAVGFARELGIKEILVFPTSPVFSAFGAAAADVVHSRVVTLELAMPVAAAHLNGLLAAVEDELRGRAGREGFRAEDLSWRRSVSMRYRRQTFGVEVALPAGRLDEAAIGALQEVFEKQYEVVFGAGSGYPHAGTEISSLRVDLVAALHKPRLRPETGGRAGGGRGDRARAAAVPARSRPAHFDGAMRDTAVHDLAVLSPGDQVRGPAIIESDLTTIVVPPDWLGALDGYRNVVISAEGGRS